MQSKSLNAFAHAVFIIISILSFVPLFIAMSRILSISGIRSFLCILIFRHINWRLHNPKQF